MEFSHSFCFLNIFLMKRCCSSSRLRRLHQQLKLLQLGHVLRALLPQSPSHTSHTCLPNAYFQNLFQFYNRKRHNADTALLPRTLCLSPHKCLSPRAMQPHSAAPQFPHPRQPLSTHLGHPSP